MTLSPIAQAVHTIANLVRTIEDMFGHPQELAIDYATRSFIDTASEAANRSGYFRFETSSETIEEALFHSSVAKDIQDNTFRPSTGPVRDYLIHLLNS